VTGRFSTAVLQNGIDGGDGAIHIYVRMEGGHVDGPFLSAYKLEVSGFDIIDGNDDGILEFGDEITLANIRVSNIGLSCEFPAL
jgi:hypothetical protein